MSDLRPAADLSPEPAYLGAALRQSFAATPGRYERIFRHGGLKHRWTVIGTTLAAFALAVAFAFAPQLQLAQRAAALDYLQRRAGGPPTPP